jgi:hypothetical protein
MTLNPLCLPSPLDLPSPLRLPHSRLLLLPLPLTLFSLSLPAVAQLHPCGVVEDPVCSSVSPDSTYCYQAATSVGSRCDWNESLTVWSEGYQEVDLYQRCDSPSCGEGSAPEHSLTWRFRCDWWADAGYIAAITEPERCQYVVSLMTSLVCGGGPPPPRPRSSSSSGGGQQAGEAAGLSTGATIGIVVLVLVLVAAAAAIAVFWWRRRRVSHGGLSELQGSDDRAQPLTAAAGGDYAAMAEGEPREGRDRRAV